MSARPAPARRARRAAFTLLEMMLSVATLGVVFGAVGLFQSRSQDHTKSGLARERAESVARRGLDRIAEEMRGVGATLLDPDPTSTLGTSTITYQRPSGVSGAGTILWGSPARLRLELEPGESDDGADEDGDGLVDERQLVLVRGVGALNEVEVVLCTGVAELAAGETANGADDNGDGLSDEAGFSVHRVGDLLTIQLTIAAAVDEHESVVSRISTNVALRN